MYDLIIIGGGPAAIAAGIYAGRKKLKTLLVADSFGGQSLVSLDIQNWIGLESISGLDLAQMLERHLRAHKDVEILSGHLVTAVKANGEVFSVAVNNGKTFETKTVFVATGSRRKKLGVPGEKEFDGKGVAYCATCDAPVFKDKTVAVIGGGNSALETVVDLLPYAKEIYLLVRSDSVKGDPITLDKVKKSSKVRIMMAAQATEILGQDFVTGLKYTDGKSGEAKELKLGGVFVEIGATPNSELVKDLVKISEYGEILVDHKTQQTSRAGIWAAGDVTDVLYKQNNISVGDGIKAVLNIADFLNKKS